MRLRRIHAEGRIRLGRLKQGSEALVRPAGGALRPSSKGEETRNALLDAAERLFGSKGYAGASLRDIAIDAEVRFGLVHYHFGNKGNLFKAAIDRNHPALMALISDSLSDATAKSAPLPLNLEQTVGAFLRPFLTVSVTPDHPLRHYIYMTSHMMSSYRVAELKPILGQLSSVTDLIEGRLKELLPHLTEADLLAGLYLIEAALIFMVQDPGFLDDLTKGHHAAGKIDQLVAPAIRFFSAGLRGIA
jgi:AcrR family transcriptional regulator